MHVLSYQGGLERTERCRQVLRTTTTRSKATRHLHRNKCRNGMRSKRDSFGRRHGDVSFSLGFPSSDSHGNGCLAQRFCKNLWMKFAAIHVAVSNSPNVSANNRLTVERRRGPRRHVAILSSLPHQSLSRPLRQSTRLLAISHKKH